MIRHRIARFTRFTRFTRITPIACIALPLVSAVAAGPTVARAQIVIDVDNETGPDPYAFPGMPVRSLPFAIAQACDQPKGRMHHHCYPDVWVMLSAPDGNTPKKVPVSLVSARDEKAAVFEAKASSSWVMQVDEQPHKVPWKLAYPMDGLAGPLYFVVRVPRGRRVQNLGRSEEAIVFCSRRKKPSYPACPVE